MHYFMLKKCHAKLYLQENPKSEKISTDGQLETDAAKMTKVEE